MPITIPIEIGDVIRTGKFKNKRVTVKEIGLDEYQLPTVNGKGIMKIRIEKLMPPKEPKQPIKESNMSKLTNVIKTIKELTKNYNFGIVKMYRDKQMYNFYYVSLGLPTGSRGAAYSIGGQLTSTGQTTEDAKKESTKILKQIEAIFKKTFNVEDSEISQGTSAMVLFMVSDDFGSEEFTRYVIKENILNKPNKAKLDRMIREALHSTDTEVKIKQKDKLWWICQEETDECLNAVGFETKEAAEHSALTKGYSFSGQEEMNEMEPEVLTTKKEKVKGVDKVEDMKLDKEKEIKLEILRIAKRVIREELKKKIGLNELEITDDDLIKEAQEYAKMSDEIERMEEQLKLMKDKFKKLDEKFSTMMAALEKELGSSKETFIRAKNILITIKRKGGDRTSYKYKEAFEWLYERVNPQMKKLIDETMEAHKTVTYIKSSLSVQQEAGNWLSNLYSKVKNWFVSIVKNMRATNNEANSSLDKLESMI